MSQSPVKMATVSSSSSAVPVARSLPNDAVASSFVPARFSSLRWAVFWMLAARVIYNLSQFGVLAALVNLCSTAAAGHFVLGLAVTAPVVMFCNLQLRFVLATDVRREAPFASYLAVRNLMAVIALGVILALAICAESTHVAMIIAAVGVSKLIESVSDIHYGRLQRANRTHIISRSLVIRGLTSLALATIAGLVFNSVVAVCGGLAISGLAVLLLHDLPASSDVKDETAFESHCGRPAADRRQVLRLIWKSLPLAVGGALMSLEANAPRYVVAARFDASVLAVVGVMTYALAMGQTLVSAFCYPAVPRLADYYAEGRTRAFVQLVGRLCAVGGLAGLLAIAAAAVFGRQLLFIVLGEEFAAHSTLLVITVAAAGVQVIQLTLLNALRAMRRFKIVSLVQLAGLVTTAALCAGLTGPAGVNGVGWALLLSFSCGLLLCAVLIYVSIRGTREHAGLGAY
jgi:O-antigen/teichoic acid export membrane protein